LELNDLKLFFGKVNQLKRTTIEETEILDSFLFKMNTLDVKVKTSIAPYMFVQILMNYFLESIRIKKRDVGEGKHIIFLYN